MNYWLLLTWAIGVGALLAFGLPTPNWRPIGLLVLLALFWPLVLAVCLFRMAVRP